MDSETPCTTCPASTDLEFWGIVHNRASSACTITTSTSCLVTSLELEVPGSPHGSAYLSMDCDTAETEWTLDAFGSQAEVVEYGEVSRGDWVGSMNFNDPIPGLAEVLFSVE